MKRCSCTFCKIHRKALVSDLFLNKVADLSLELYQVFSCKFSEISNNTFFIEHLWATAFGKTILLKKESMASFFQQILRNVVEDVSTVKSQVNASVKRRWFYLKRTFEPISQIAMVQSHQWKHQNKMNLFKIDDKDIKQSQ